MSSCSDDSDLFRSNNVNLEHATVYSNSDNNLIGLEQIYFKNGLVFPQILNTTDNSAKRRIKNFSLQEKVKILDDVKNGRSKAEVRKEYGIGESTLRRWIHDEQKIRDALHDENASRKKLKSDENPYVGEALIAWYNRCKHQNIQLSGIMLREKALELNKMLGGKDNFTAGSDWFTNWKRKYGLSLNITIPEDKQPPEESALSRLTMTLTNAAEDESLLRCQIFKCDKAVLHYKSLPGRRFPGDRVTIMSCSNADGSLKLPLMVFGKSVNSTTLMNLQSCLPIFYAHQTGSWIESDILNEWFDTEYTPRVTEFLKMRNLPLKAILVAENVTSDTFQNRPTSELQIHLILHNLSLVIGPVDTESLKCVRMNYAYKLLMEIVSAQEDGVGMTDHLKKINLRDFIYWISSAWEDVKTTTIVRCWKKLLPDNENSCIVTNEDVQVVNVMVIHDIMKRIEDYKNVRVDEVAEWMAENYETSRASVDNHIVEIVVKESDEDMVDDVGNMCEVNKTTTAAEALKGLNEAIAFFEQTGNSTLEEMTMLVRMRNKALESKINAK